MTFARARVSQLVGLLRPLGLNATTQGTIAQRGALSMVGLLAQGGLRFATSWIIGLVAGKVVLGTVVAAMSMGTLLALLWPTTTGSAASKYIARARGAQDGIELHAVTAHFRRRAIQSGILLALLAFPLWATIGNGQWSDAWAVSAFTASYAAYTFTRGVQYGTGQVARATLWDVGCAGMGLAVLLTLLLLGVRGPALLVALALSYATYAIGGLPRGVDSGAPLATSLRSELDQVVFFGVAGSVASSGFLQISMIVAKNLNAADAGQFAAAMTTATPASLLAASLSLVLFPALAEAWGRGDKALFRTQTDQATRVLVLAMITVFGSMILCSRLIMSLWGSQFNANTLVFPLLLLAILLSNMSNASVNAMATRSKNLMQLSSAASLIGLAVGALVWLLVIPSLGIVGIAIGYLAGTFMGALIPVATEWRIGGHRWGLLFGRAVVGLLLLLGLFLLERVMGVPTLAEPVVALFFCLLWWGMSRKDLRLVRRPRASPACPPDPSRSALAHGTQGVLDRRWQPDRRVCEPPLQALEHRVAPRSAEFARHRSQRRDDGPLRQPHAPPLSPRRAGVPHAVPRRRLHHGGPVDYSRAPRAGAGADHRALLTEPEDLPVVAHRVKQRAPGRVRVLGVCGEEGLPAEIGGHDVDVPQPMPRDVDRACRRLPQRH